MIGVASISIASLSSPTGEMIVSLSLQNLLEVEVEGGRSKFSSSKS